MRPSLPPLVILFCFFGFLTVMQGQTVSVTFKVDMGNEEVSPAGVHIAGDFQLEAGFAEDWNPGITSLSDDNEDQVYEITVTIPPGTYQYKFINGDAWGMDENPPANCTVGSTFNRQVIVENTDLNLPPVPFNSCNAMLFFAINMKDQTLSPDGIHVMGDFQEAAGLSANWDPTAIQMEDFNADGTYEVEVAVPPGDYQYLFVNGNTLTQAEMPPANCTVAGEDDLRYRTITATVEEEDNPVYCFNTCESCPPSISTSYETHWWNDAVFYEIFVRSFYDSDGDGIGDFQGIIEKLDYLNDGNPDTDQDLGITGIWLMPMMTSPSYHGYDVTNYYATEPDYGTMEDFEQLLDEAHARGIKVIIDFVMNHTSNQHSWFVQSTLDQNDYRNWYIWSDNNPGWNGPWGQEVWHNNGGDYYYGLFWSGMPDLNYSHPAVKEELFNITNFWLDKGVDGFRLDAIKYLDEDGTVLEHTPETFSILEEFNTVYKTNNPEAFTVGEVWDNTNVIIPYVQNDRMDVCFEFGLAGDILNAVNGNAPQAVTNRMHTVQVSYPKLQYASFLTNHDIDRVYSQLGRDAAKMKQAAAMYLTLPGIPFIYYGEEVGMTGTGIHENIRRPMQWTDGLSGGFSTTTPWYGLGDNYLSNNVEGMEDDPNSLLQHYKKLIHIRNEQAALRKGYYLEVDHSEPSVLSYARVFGEEAVIVLSNFGDATNPPALSLPVSSLPAGNYYVTDLYQNEAMGTVMINENGGFSDWQITGEVLNNRQTWILLLSLDNPVITSNIFPKNLTLSLFPNPAVEQVQIKLDQPLDGQVEVFDTSGKTLSLYHLRNGQVVIPTGQLPAGMYFIKAMVEGRTKVKHLIVAQPE